MRTTLNIAIILLLFSCQSVKLSKRSGLDTPLSDQNMSQLNGDYFNNYGDTAENNLYNFWQRISNKDVKIDDWKNTKVNLQVKGHKRVEAQLKVKDTIIEQKTLKGRFKRGYFSINNRYKARIAKVPIVWGFGGFKLHIGRTTEGDLVLLESNFGLAILAILPVFVAGDTHHFEYKKL